jgi:hypothetical protein
VSKPYGEVTRYGRMMVDTNTNLADYHKALIVRLRQAAEWVEHQSEPAPDWDGLLKEAATAISMLEALRLLQVASEDAEEVIRLIREGKP